MCNCHCEGAQPYCHCEGAQRPKQSPASAGGMPARDGTVLAGSRVDSTSVWNPALKGRARGTKPAARADAPTPGPSPAGGGVMGRAARGFTASHSDRQLYSIKRSVRSATYSRGIASPHKGRAPRCPSARLAMTTGGRRKDIRN